MTTYHAPGNVYLPTFKDIRHWYLAVTKDGDPANLQTISPQMTQDIWSYPH